MILNTEYDEDVNGVVVGRYKLICSLMYEGRKQGKTIYADDEVSAAQAASSMRDGIVRSCGQAALDIFPHDSWEVRIYMG